MGDDANKNTITEYILCFPPGIVTAGNFFVSIAKAWKWQPMIINQYAYVAERKVNCIFFQAMPVFEKQNAVVRFLLNWKLCKLKKTYGAEQNRCKIYKMEEEQDYPYSLRLVLVEDFIQKIHYGKRVHVGFVEGDALSRKDLITFIRVCCERINYLTVFTKDAEAYREVAEDAWQQYGLAITVTQSYAGLSLCDYVLDCSVLPFSHGITCRKGCIFYSVWGDRDKIRSVRRMGDGIRFDSCAASLDRAFHNKV